MLFKKKKVKKPIEKILVIRFSSIGDIVLTTPILRCIKNKYPNVELHYYTKKAFSGILEANPNVDKVHVLSDDINEDLNQLKAEKFDRIIDLHHNLRTLRVKRALSKVKSYSFPKLNIEKWLYVHLKWNLLPKTSIVERYFKAVLKLGVVNDGKGLDFFIPEEKQVDKDDIPMSHWLGYVACVIGGSYATKQFPVNKWKEFVELCKFPIILLGGPEDRAMGEEIVQADESKVYNACGKFSLMESADLVQKARVVISNDTGLMHVAAAFQKPLISLWGNTTPSLGMFPYYGANNLLDIISQQFTIEKISNLSCRPCSKIGFATCPKKHFKCMQLIDNHKVNEHLDLLWKDN